MSVCSAWRQHLKQPGLPLWQARPGLPCLAIYLSCFIVSSRSNSSRPECNVVTAQAASIPDNRIWGEAIEGKLPLFLMLQRWLRRCGGGLLQLQCRTSFCRWVRRTAYSISIPPYCANAVLLKHES